MPSKPTQKTGQQAESRSRVLARQMYEDFMAIVEPDLMTSNIGTLAEKYGNEPPEEKELREKHYKGSFELLDELWATFTQVSNEEFAHYRQEILDAYQSRTGREDAAKLSNIEQSFDA